MSTVSASEPRKDPSLAEPHVSGGPSQPTELFTAAELKRFREEDAAAGHTLGRILCGGFTFTMIASGAAGFWTAWHYASESIIKIVVLPAIVLITCCIAVGWGNAMMGYCAEHSEDA